MPPRRLTRGTDISAVISLPKSLVIIDWGLEKQSLLIIYLSGK